MTAIWRGFGYALDKREYDPAKLVQYLLEKGAEVNTVDYSGTTPLMEAASAGHVETIKALVTRGADMRRMNNEGKTALDLAAKERRGRAVQTLIDSGAPLTLKQKVIYSCYRFARIQGWILPFVILISFLIGYYGKKYTRPEAKRNAVEKGDELPHLAPIKCAACGAGVPLQPENMSCPRCNSPVPVPEDYAGTMKLREKAARGLQKATAAWRRANRFTIWPIRWALWLIAPPWLAATLIGCFSNIGNSLFAASTSAAFLALFATLGGISLVIAFWSYAFYLSGTRKRLPLIPSTSRKVGEAQFGNCHLCGGSIFYSEGDLAAVCGYCGGETYRVAVARRAHAVAAEEKEQVSISLHDAMAEIAERRRRGFKYLMYASGIIFGFVFAVLIIAL
jgi:Ankyrin repeats (3 copies)